MIITIIIITYYYSPSHNFIHSYHLILKFTTIAIIITNFTTLILYTLSKGM